MPATSFFSTSCMVRTLDVAGKRTGFEIIWQIVNKRKNGNKI